MQTNLNKNSVFFERLMQMIEYKGFSTLNNFAIKALGYSSSEKLNRLKSENNKPSINIIQDISNKFDDISIEWLLFGKGEMLKGEQPRKEPSREDRLLSLIESQQRTIENLSSKK